MASEILPGILVHSHDEYLMRLNQIESTSARWAHLDVMDGHFVPNTTLGLDAVGGTPTRLSLEAHLMVVDPFRYVTALQVAGVRRVIIHREIAPSLAATGVVVERLKQFFPEVGIAVNPETQLEDYRSLPIDELLIMGVHPGYSGQEMLGETLERVRIARGLTAATLGVDGGVREEAIAELAAAGAQRFVVTSQLYSASDLAARYTKLASAFLSPHHPQEGFACTTT